MEMGGEPERDESGLPPVDIEIPDDAQELERDVQAYYREVRAARRHRRFERLIAPFTRHGMVVPLVAGTLAVTLFAGTMLTVITSTPPEVPSSISALRSPAPLSSPPVPPARQVGGPLPRAEVFIDNKPLQLRDLSPSVLALVPPTCGCLVALQQLAAQASAAQIKIYFVGNASGLKQVTSLAARAGRGNITVIDDAQNVLGNSYDPVGLTAILVHKDSAVGSVRRKLIPGFKLDAELVLLAKPGLGKPDAPAPG